MPSCRGYPYDSGGVFELHTLSWDKDVLALDLGYNHGLLPAAYKYATGQSFWDEVRRTVVTACPGCTECPRIADLDYDLYFALGAQDFDQKAIKVKEFLEQRAQQTWLRPGVPKLFSVVLKCLNSRANLVTSLVEFQQRHGYANTRQVVDQFSDCLLSQ